MEILAIPALLLLTMAWGYQILALISLGRFFRRPLPPAPAGPRPGVTVFKPLKGLEPDTRECLESFLTQDYRPYQVLFGVADPWNPVLPLVEELRRRHPQADVEIVICPRRLGLNPKVSSLRQMAAKARYGLWIIADADVRVGPDFLSCMAGALLQPGVGAVSCLYRAGPPATLGAGLETLTIAADFIPSVAAAHYVEGTGFALGAAMAVTTPALQAAGGLMALADFLADDYQLGYRVARAGYEVQVLPYVVETRNPAMSFKEYLSHQLRWARTYRVCRPGGYLAYGVTHALVYAALTALALGLHPGALVLAAATLGLRFTVAWFSERRCLGGSLSPALFLLLPLKDFLAFALWLLSFLGDRVVWGGLPFKVQRDGTLVPE